MSSRRTLILIGAVVIGGLAAFLTLNYVKGVENDNAEKNQLVDVLVASGPIAEGASADDAMVGKLISTAKRRRADLPANAVSRSAEISGQVAAVQLGGGEVITSLMFVSADARTGSNSTILDKGNVAVTISADPASGVADLIQVGDSINILVKATPPADGAIEGEAAGGLTPAGAGWTIPNPYVALFQAVKVVAVGQNTTQPSPPGEVVEGEVEPAPAPTSSGLITVQLPPDQAVLLTSVKDSGLYLTLNRPDYEPVPLPFTQTFPTFSGELGLTPYPELADGTKGQ